MSKLRRLAAFLEIYFPPKALFACFEFDGRFLLSTIKSERIPTLPFLSGFLVSLLSGLTALRLCVKKLICTVMFSSWIVCYLRYDNFVKQREQK